MIFSSGYLLTIFVGAFLNLDKQVFGPFMISRPLMVGLIMGLITGEINYCLWLGLSVELLWLASVPLGGQLTPNSGLAVTAALAAWLGSGFNPAANEYQAQAGLVISFLTVPFWAWAFASLDKISRRWAQSSVNRAWENLEAGRDDPEFFRLNIRGLGITLALSLGALIPAVLVNQALLYFLGSWSPEFVLSQLVFMFSFIPFLGLIGMAAFMERRHLTFYIYGLLASLLALSAV